MPHNSPRRSPCQQALPFSVLVLPYAGPTSVPGPWAGSWALPTVSTGAPLPDLLRCRYLVVLLDERGRIAVAFHWSRSSLAAAIL
ncbi:hypothetical protein NDU88_002589 [Pleurodeles waltl]|uniref:Uncharacterized protein n=1 Tax=Pleurodeles waltl TaxID=8319 RepID=A0AAV7TM75_PLEWA|nr:hypothetical protein NDU88_002589 [Pleurodeles waltl]